MRALMLAFARGWVSAPRLLRALHDADCATAFLVVPGTLLEKSGFAAARYFSDNKQVIFGYDLLHAVNAFEPDRLIPGDELVVRWLHSLYSDAATPVKLRELIVTSLGDPTWYACMTDKLRAGELAASLGIATPLTRDLATDAAAHDFILAHGWPVAIKARVGFGGEAVFACSTLRAVRNALHRCPAGQLRLIQHFELGRTWMACFVAEGGRLLAMISAEKEQQHPRDTGPSTIVRFKHDPEMQSACAALVEATGYSGFGSIEFLRTRDGRVLFLEFNPRLTSISHLGARFGVDLAAAFADGRTRDSTTQHDGQRVALFPQELRRDPSGNGLVGCFHDVPQDEPELLAALKEMVPFQARGL